MRWSAIGLFLVSACSGGAKAPAQPAQPVARTVTAGALDSLPQVAVTNGRLVCLADNVNPCQVTTATANWLDNGKYATWEPQKPVLVWTPNKTDPEFLGEVGNRDSQYNVVMSVAATNSGYVVLSQANGTAHATFYNKQGRYTSNLPAPPVSISRARGFAGRIGFYQLIHDAGQDSAAEFEVREVDGQGDTVGTTVLKAKLPWLRLRDSRPVAPVPLLPTLPSYAITDDSDIVWTNGDLFNVERRSVHGVVRWSLMSDAPGPVFSPEDRKALRAKVPADDKARLAAFDSSAAHTGKYFPAASALLVSPEGRVLVVQAQIPSHDSVGVILLGPTGEPLGRFKITARTRPLLFGGDSLLVQRPGANTNPELRWLRLNKP
jgi:hypothetical protein